MVVFLENNKYFYETEKVIRLFLPFEKIVFNSPLKQDRVLKATFLKNKVLVELIIDKKSVNECVEVTKDKEHSLIKATYLCFTKMFNYSLDWGLLTGIRPARLFISLTNQFGINKAVEIFKKDYLVKDSKIELLKQTAISEEKIIALSKENSASLYVSIPFCPSKCGYCSFVSDATNKALELKEEYVKTLALELIDIAKYVNKYNLSIETVYIGGGTPSMLSDKELAFLLKTISDNFDLKNIKEFTVEMGRPDTTTKEKLLAVKPYATRICINPQSLNNDCLVACKRNHTKEDFIKTFNMAKELGFNNINCDLIAGLPLDTPQSFKNSLEELIALNPSGITVHTLCLKRAANFYKDAYYEVEEGKDVSLMTNSAKTILIKNGYMPYYLYRQSKTIGNLENIGYSKPGYEGLYNVYIMDETHTILGAGAGAVTKLRRYNKNEIERIYNYKFPFEYISNFNEMLLRKQKIGEFYDAHTNTNK